MRDVQTLTGRALEGVIRNAAKGTCEVTLPNGTRVPALILGSGKNPNIATHRVAMPSGRNRWVTMTVPVGPSDRPVHTSNHHFAQT